MKDEEKNTHTSLKDKKKKFTMCQKKRRPGVPTKKPTKKYSQHTHKEGKKKLEYVFTRTQNIVFCVRVKHAIESNSKKNEETSKPIAKDSAQKHVDWESQIQKAKKDTERVTKQQQEEWTKKNGRNTSSQRL